jgi:glucose-1-phosphate adenylyltransferase
MPSSPPPAKFVHDEEDRRGMAIPRWSPATASSRAPRCAQLLFTGVRTAFLLAHRRGGDPAACHIGRRARLSARGHRRGVHIPEGLVVGEDPELDAKRFRAPKAASA